MTPNFARTRLACYFTYIAAGPVFCLPAMLFVTFQEMYGIPYTLLGTLVAVNFCTQLGIDLLFSFFPKCFNIKLALRTMPLLTSLGLLIYSIVPTFWPSYTYIGLLVGTVLFSVAAGLGEALISPTIAALPSDNPDRDMSKLHSLYGWGVFGVVVVSTVFFYLFGTEKWMYLTMAFAVLPLISSFLYCVSPIPDLGASHGKDTATAATKHRRIGLILCVSCIFLGGAAETTMTNWISSYMEISLRIPKAICDIVGLALFALLLAGVRTIYAKWGKNIWRTLMVGMIGAVVCYLVAGLSQSAAVALVACGFKGCCTSMLWPGTLILMEEKMPHLGVAAYALMAAGGDFGASVAPQMMGIVVDTVAASDWGSSLALSLSMTPDQLGMKVGMLIAAIFPVLGIGVLLVMRRHFKRKTA